MTPEIKFAHNLVVRYLSNNGEPTNEGIIEMGKIAEESFENNYTTLLEHCKAIKKILNTAIKQMKGSKNV